MALDDARASRARLDKVADRLNIGRDAASVRQRVEAMEYLLERSITKSEGSSRQREPSSNRPMTAASRRP